MNDDQVGTTRASRRVIAGLAASALLALPRRAGAQASATPTPSGVLTIAAGGTDNWHPGDPKNTDVLMIARLDVRARTLRAVSVSYDLWAAIPGHGYDKIARAYDFASRPRMAPSRAAPRW